MARLRLQDGCRMPIDAFVQRLLRGAGVAVQALPLQWPAALLRRLTPPAIPDPRDTDAVLAAVDRQLNRHRHLRRPLTAQLCVFGQDQPPRARRQGDDDVYVVVDGVGMVAFGDASAPIRGLSLELSPGDYVHIAANVSHTLTSADGGWLTAVRFC